ncbi:MAG: ribulose-5-phosphate 4-epimerase-like epimerase or aldolase [Actinomycetia bacterium]|nr:ribulose-5-phosphate 4-epimerase-like epimerase or aldolase [Actinomycetes bacterium]
MSTPQHEQVLAAAKDMLEKDLTEGTAGNLSARLPDGNVVITPSSVDYRSMALEDLCVIDLDGNQVSGERRPSSEQHLHLACYLAFPDVHAVIHAHPIYASMFAVARLDIPAAIDEFTIYCGGDVRVTEYAMTGSPELGEAAVKALEGRGAALLANHGTIAVGPSPAKALHITALVERSAQIVWGARQLGGEHHLPDEVNATFSSYYGFMRQSP